MIHMILMYINELTCHVHPNHVLGRVDLREESFPFPFIILRLSGSGFALFSFAPWKSIGRQPRSKHTYRVQRSTPITPSDNKNKTIIQ